ncbi:hypothetical protein ACFVXE_21530 [Streptomyces sp. NPDC058231]|uniref:hypothetical protein n=1 Tax=Streptomyces sp. NPDC058231 TaxID=3346392 RepID=UPI0036E4D30E
MTRTRYLARHSRALLRTATTTAAISALICAATPTAFADDTVQVVQPSPLDSTLDTYVDDVTADDTTSDFAANGTATAGLTVPDELVTGDGARPADASYTNPDDGPEYAGIGTRLTLLGPAGLGADELTVVSEGQEVELTEQPDGTLTGDLPTNLRAGGTLEPGGKAGADFTLAADSDAPLGPLSVTAELTVGGQNGEPVLTGVRASADTRITSDEGSNPTPSHSWPSLDSWPAHHAWPAHQRPSNPVESGHAWGGETGGEHGKPDNGDHQWSGGEHGKPDNGDHQWSGGEHGKPDNGGGQWTGGEYGSGDNGGDHQWSGGEHGKPDKGDHQWSGGGHHKPEKGNEWSGGGHHKPEKGNHHWSGGGHHKPEKGNHHWTGGGHQWSGKGNHQWSGKGNEWSGGGHQWSGKGNHEWSGKGNEWSGGGHHWSGGHHGAKPHGPVDAGEGGLTTQGTGTASAGVLGTGLTGSHLATAAAGLMAATAAVSMGGLRILRRRRR